MLTWFTFVVLVKNLFSKTIFTEVVSVSTPAEMFHSISDTHPSVNPSLVLHVLKTMLNKITKKDEPTHISWRDQCTLRKQWSMRMNPHRMTQEMSRAVTGDRTRRSCACRLTAGNSGILLGSQWGSCGGLKTEGNMGGCDASFLRVDGDDFTTSATHEKDPIETVC